MPKKNETAPAREKKIPTGVRENADAPDRERETHGVSQASPPATRRSISTPPGEPYNDVLLRRQK
jgi:hypothetical protein